jgi:hypothetical protein
LLDRVENVEFLSRNDSVVTLKLSGIRRKYTILASNDFVSWVNVMTISNVVTTTVEASVVADGPMFFRAVEGAPY